MAPLTDRERSVEGERERERYGGFQGVDALKRHGQDTHTEYNSHMFQFINGHKKTASSFWPQFVWFALTGDQKSRPLVKSG